MKDDFVSSARSVSDIKAHLVLCTKYRRKEFNTEMLARLKEIFADLSEKWSCKLIEFNGEEDHIHLLFQYYPQMDLSNLFTTIANLVGFLVNVQRAIGRKT
jgi:Transposase and inactivated derivatives